MSKAKRIPGLKGNPKSMRISKTLRNGKMPAERKTVQGPHDPSPRVRGGKAGNTRRYLPFGHVARTHDNFKWNGQGRGDKSPALPLVDAPPCGEKRRRARGYHPRGGYCSTRQRAHVWW